MSSSTKPARKIVKTEQFNAFIKAIKAGQISYWKSMAEGLGVDRETIRIWSKTPEAQEAIKQGMDHALAQMEIVGRKDWRMWDRRLQILGINPANKVEAEVKKIDITERILREYGLISDNGEDQGTAKDPSPQKT